MSVLLRRQLNGGRVPTGRFWLSPATLRWRGIATSAAAAIPGERTSEIPPPAVPAPSILKTAFPNPQPLQRPSPRWEAVRTAKPFSEFLTDNFQRQHTYLRISITERCNLRCVYCMPEEGVPLTPDSKLLSTAEILHIANLFVSQGVTKIRLTGGEPTIRRDIIELIAELGKLKSKGLKELAITSNGLVLARKLDKMVDGGLTAVNLSLDTLEPWKFEVMTRRKGLENVLKTIDKALELGVQPLKLNCVVMRGVNDYEIPAFVEMTREKPIEIRFIEYMPFDGNKWNENKMVPFADMLSQIQSLHPTIAKVADPSKNETSKTYQIPGFAGKIGFITSMTHNFCGTCNRLRVTGDGNLKVCLFGNEEVSLRDMMRTNELRKKIVQGAAGPGEMQDGVVEKELVEMEKQMLNVIGVAVKGKREKHAGMGDLEHMKNRPMILIGNPVPRANTFSSSWATHYPLSSIPTHLLTPIPTPIQPRLIRLYSTKPPAPILHPHSPPNLHPRTTITTTTPTPSSPPPFHPPPPPAQTPPPPPPPQNLTHLTPTGSAHMVPITHKPPTPRTATATCTIHFSTPHPYPLIHTNALKKGDALSVARIAGIMAAKQTPALIPLCHPILLEGVEVVLRLLPPGGEGGGEGGEFGGVDIAATVRCEGKTGVEMEALVAATAAGLTVYDMCKGVDRGMVLGGVRVVEKRGGRSGDWVVDEGGKLVSVGGGGKG